MDEGGGHFEVHFEKEFVMLCQIIAISRSIVQSVMITN